jgi:putative ABC transport system ATP-binding protein
MLDSVKPDGFAKASRPSAALLFRVEQLALHYDDGMTRALEGIDIDIAEGEFVAVVGPSGCGKSSLLHLLGMLETPTAGQLHFRSESYSAVRSRALFRRRHFGFVFQAFHLLPALTALENVLIPTVGCAGPARAYRERARHLLARLGLGGMLHRLPGNMSGGERQRVAIARALINKPEVMLADEPTGSLDSRNAGEVLDLIDEMRGEEQLTVVLVTHDPDVSTRADRIIRLRDGMLDPRVGGSG